jgi:hypothetical protein
MIVSASVRRRTNEDTRHPWQINYMSTTQSSPPPGNSGGLGNGLVISSARRQIRHRSEPERFPRHAFLSIIREGCESEAAMNDG